MSAVSEMQGLMIDMDGVLWRGKNSLPGAAELFSALRSRSVPFMLVTNNASASPESVQSKLQTIWVDVRQEEVLGSAEATAAWLGEHQPPGTAVYVIGEHTLHKTLSRAGFDIRSLSAGVRAVVVGIDRQVDWHKLTEASLAIRAGAMFVGTNPDPSFPTERGLAPGNGAMLAALLAATDVEPVIIGKPEPHLFKQALARLGTPPEATLVLGDRLETDILGGQQAGMPTALLLTGVTRQEDLAEASIRPDYVFDDLPGFLKAFDESET
jgi:4-nitrophenyl phosphatase